MRLHQRWLLLLASAAMLFATACGERNGTPRPASEETPFEISIMAVLHTSKLPDDEVMKLVERKTGAELDVKWISGEIYYEKLKAAMATDSLPMAVSTGSQSFYKELKDAIRHGEFWEIGPYLEKYGNLRRLDEDVLRSAAVDGKIYGLYQERPRSRQGVIYRKDWLDRLGLEPPTTVDELFEMLVAFAERDPDGDGLRNTIGLAERNDMVYGAFKTVSSYFGVPNQWGVKDGGLEPEFMFPAYIETMNFFRSLRERGAVNADFPVTSKSAQRDLFINGTAGAYIGSLSDAVGLYREAAKRNPKAEVDVANRIEGPNGPGVWSIPGYGAAFLFPKSSISSEAELERVLSFYDALMDPEVYHLLQYGIEGRHYEKTDGKANMIADPEVVEREVKPLIQLQIGGPSTIDAMPPYETDALSVKVGERIKDNDNMLIDDPTLGLESRTFDELGGRLQRRIADAAYQYMLGQIDDDGFREAVVEWRAQGGDKMIAEYNEQYRRKTSTP
ncbi:extracellular solute-binding protein [Paenibacillus sp.]|uniref:extracellular solute-binding protein n=1 Tax=Paenibacillus sp. TaxID=58172 RepID=UPI002812388F|nr:extracellular solute-binding protein [Paenibacillus sp.]